MFTCSTLFFKNNIEILQYKSNQTY